MSTSFPERSSIYPINHTLRQERNYEGSIEKQIEQEELNYKAAMKADKTFEEVKAIRERIKYLKSLLNQNS